MTEGVSLEDQPIYYVLHVFQTVSVLRAVIKSTIVVDQGTKSWESSIHLVDAGNE